MLHERRTESELARLLAEQLMELRAGRLAPVAQWLHTAQELRKDQEAAEG